MNERDLKVLEQYDLQITGTCRGRGSYLCETADGVYLLKEYPASQEKAVALQGILQALQDSKRLRVDCFVKNRDGAFITKDREQKSFLLKKWCHGRECDVKNIDEVIRGARELGVLHSELRKVAGIELNQAVSDCGREFSKRIRELKKIRNYISRKNGKTSFEFLYASQFDRFFEDARKAAEGVGELEDQRPALCHGDYTQHNILFCGDEIYIVNFDKCHYGSQMMDLYLFMRKILEKYDWDISAGINIIEAYEEENPVSDRQKRELSLRFLFPEKFWKLSNHYYNSRKVWGVERNKSKLEKLMEQNEKKKMFLEAFFHGETL